MKLEDAIKGILEQRKAIHSQNLWSDPNHLSEVMLKLATYNAYLADHLATLHHTVTEAVGRIFKAERDKDAGVTEAERLSKSETVEERRQYENVQHIYKSTSNLISVLQSRLRVISEQYKQEGV